MKKIKLFLSRIKKAIISLADWFKAWTYLGFPIRFKNRYDKDYNIMLSEALDGCVVKYVGNDHIKISNYDGKKVFEIYMNSRFFDYGSKFWTSKGSYMIDYGARASIKNMAWLYYLEKNYTKNRWKLIK